MRCEVKREGVYAKDREEKVKVVTFGTGHQEENNESPREVKRYADID